MISNSDYFSHLYLEFILGSRFFILCDEFSSKFINNPRPTWMWLCSYGHEGYVIVIENDFLGARIVDPFSKAVWIRNEMWWTLFNLCTNTFSSISPPYSLVSLFSSNSFLSALLIILVPKMLFPEPNSAKVIILENKKKKTNKLDFNCGSVSMDVCGRDPQGDGSWETTVD